MTWEEIMEQADIVEYISQFVDLEYRNGEYWGLSPFKEENTPSFSVRRETQLFNDFSSEIKGNIYNFIMEYFHIEFAEAIKVLKDYLKIEDDGEYIPQPQIIKVMKSLKPKVKKKDISERKILPNNFMDKFQKTPITLWQEEGISQEIMDFYQVRFDPLKEAIVFPVWDNDGKIINVKGRNVGKHWKEMGLPKYYHMFKLGTIDYLWGLNFKRDIIKEKKEVILVESEKSVMKLEGWGVKNAVALCNGKITDAQLRLIIGLQSNVVLALDKDKNGQKLECENLLKQYTKFFKIADKTNLLSQKDAPCDKGLEVWEKLYNDKRQV